MAFDPKAFWFHLDWTSLWPRASHNGEACAADEPESRRNKTTGHPGPLSLITFLLPSLISNTEIMLNHHETDRPPFLYQKQFHPASTSYTPFCPYYASSRIIELLRVLKRVLSDGTYPYLHCPQPPRRSYGTSLEGISKVHEEKEKEKEKEGEGGESMSQG